MPHTCPVCKASNDTGPNCRRCKADLGLLVALEATRDARLSEAIDCLKDDRARQALADATAADQIRRGPDTARVLALASILNGRFEEAWEAYQAAGQHD